MYTGPLVFTQVMDFMPLKTFQRCVEKYQGNFSVKNFTCLDQFRIMAFAQLTYRESLRDIEACLRAQSNKLYHMGIRSKVSRRHPGGSERDAGLAHLRRFCPSSDRHRQETLPEGTVGSGTSKHGLRPGCNDDRSVPVHFSLGTLPDSKGGRPTSYPAGSAGQYPKLHPHLRRKTPRGQRSGHHSSGSRRFLHHGSRLHGLLQTLRCYSSLRFLRDPSQVQSQEPQALFPSSGQIHRGCVRPIHPTDRSQVSRGLSRQTPPGEILRRRDRQNLGVSDQQLSSARHYHRPALQTTMAGGAILQMDQTTPTHQELFRHFGERGEDSNLDCYFRLSDCGDHQKTVESPGKSLHNFTGFEYLPI